MQMGPTTGDFPKTGRLYVPDFEIDLGLTNRVELDIDGSLTVEPLRTAPAQLMFGEPLWTAAKLGFFDVKNEGPTRSAALGMQLGPRLSIGPNTPRGVGYGALLLGAADFGPARIVLNAGGMADATYGGHALGFMNGVNLWFDIGEAGKWGLVGNGSYAHYFTVLPDQLTFTAGVGYDGEDVDWSVSALASPIGDDRVGILLGCSPRFHLY